jgi:hypothetical protein
MMASVSPEPIGSNFLDLPQEVRIMIYRFLFIKDKFSRCDDLINFDPYCLERFSVVHPQTPDNQHRSCFNPLHQESARD